MRFCITDDDSAIRSTLSQLIEDEDLGEVVEEVVDGDFLDASTLNLKQIDILFIDLLMPGRDGIETIRHLKDSFKGKMIMISQVESKELIGEAYSLGIEYYITKPINRIEILTVIRKVIERISLEKSIDDIKTSLNSLATAHHAPPSSQPITKQAHLYDVGKFLLAELGIVGENGAKDLLDILQFLYTYDQRESVEKHFPSLKNIFVNVAEKKLGAHASSIEINRETKACEQRIRRAVTHSLNHFASIGLTDFSNPKFENYASKFFDFTAVRKKMKELQGDSKILPIRINTKKFIQIFFLEAKRLLSQEKSWY
ncbi:response regulator [Bacillus megaterium]|nr:response regulator [Priestia megaterium]